MEKASNMHQETLSKCSENDSINGDKVKNYIHYIISYYVQ